MVVVVKMDTGHSFRLDRNLRASDVAETINEARGKGKLVEFQDNFTPSRAIYIDPDHVTLIQNDGYTY